MVSKSFRESGHLFGSLDALQHGRAFLLSAATWLLALALWALADFLLPQLGWGLPVVVLAVLSAMVLIGGANAAGIITMDDVAGRPRRPRSVLWRDALSASQRMVMVLLTLILCALLALLALTLLLLICRLPIVGPWLYALVLPLATVIAALVLFVFPVFVLALSAPAIWCGVDASTSLAQIWSVTRKRLPETAAWLLVLTAITAAVCLLLMGVLALGFWLVNAMSVSLLGTTGAWPTSFSLVDRALSGDSSNYANAASSSAVAVAALVCTAVGLVAQRGICLVYGHALNGLDTAPEQQLVQAALSGAHPGLSPLQSNPPLQPAAIPVGAFGTGHVQPLVDFAASTSRHQDAAPPSERWTPPIEPRHPSVDIDLEVPAQRSALGAYRTWGVESENRPQRGQFLPDLQPTIPKSDRLLGKRACPACGSNTELTDFYCGECGASLR